MADSLTLRTIMKITGAYIRDLDLGSDPAYNLAVSNVEDFANGTSANQAQVVFTDTRPLAASASEDLDLAGSLLDAYGRTITFTAIKGIYVKAADDNTNNVLVGGAASNQFYGLFGAATDKVVVKPGGAFMYIDPGAAGLAVTASTGDLLKIANSSSGTGVTYDIVIFGEGTVA